MSGNPHEGDWAIKALEEAIESDGRGVSAYAKRVLVRPPGTVYLWLRGASPVQKCVREYLVGSFRILEVGSNE